MTLEERLASALSRIASTTNVIRTRSYEETQNGYHSNESRAGLETLVVRLEAAVEKLEKAVA